MIYPDLLEGAVITVTSKAEPIEVCQLNNPGGMNHGKWYVSRGSGRNTEYLRTDGTWHANTSTGGFFWSISDEAEQAKQSVLEQESMSPP